MLEVKIIQAVGILSCSSRGEMRDDGKFLAPAGPLHGLNLVKNWRGWGQDMNLAAFIITRH